jgi:phosphate transport system substrate-binding protein
MKRALALSVVVALAAGLVTGDTAHAAEPVLGAGSTFAEVALDQWAADVNIDQSLSVDYSGNGSTGGITQFQQGVVDFASSDVRHPDEIPITRDFRYIPIVAGGTAVMYNLRDRGGQIDNLQLSPETVAAIFFNDITKWNDQRIKDENPHLESRLPDLEIKRAVRTQGSGTTGVFTDFLSTVAPQAWTDFVARLNVRTQAGGNYTTDWPMSNGVASCGCYAYAGSNEIANQLANSSPGANGTIGYAEAAYAEQLKVPVAYIRNRAGFYRLPSARNVAVALLSATENGDGTQNLEGVFTSDRAEAYPASSYNYLVIPTEGLSEGQGETLGKYVIYSVTEGQSKADILGYSPLPPNLVQYALNRVPEIDGAPAPPPLGDWGRFYEDLEVEEEKPPVDPNPGGGGQPGGEQPGGGGQQPGGGEQPGGDGEQPGGEQAGGEQAGGEQAGGDGEPGGGGPSGTPQAQGSTVPGAPTSSTTPCVTPTTTTLSSSSTSSSTPPSSTTSTSLGSDTASTSPTSTVVTTTTNPCPPVASTTTRPGAGATVTSINSAGSVVVVESANQPETIGLRPGLRFNNDTNELETIDGKKVPKVDGLGVGELLGISAVIIGLLGLPPLLVGAGVFKRRSRARM